MAESSDADSILPCPRAFATIQRCCPWLSKPYRFTSHTLHLIRTRTASLHYLCERRMSDGVPLFDWQETSSQR